MPELEYYYFPASFYSLKGLIALEEKQLSFRRRVVLLIFAEVYEPWYMRINPNGTVPTLKHGDTLVQDSQDIIHYIDEHFPERPLIPRDATFRAKVVECQRALDSIDIEMLSYGSLANRHLTKNAAIPDALASRAKATMHHKVSDDMVNKLKAYQAANPDLKAAYDRRLDILKHRVETGYSDMTIPEASVKEGLKHAEKVLGDMNTLLEENDKAGAHDNWLCGPDFTEADVLLGLTLQRMTHCGFSFVWLESMPKLEKYFQRVSKRPSFSNQFSAAANMRILSYMMFRHKAPYVVGGLKMLLAGAAAYGVYWLVSGYLMK